MTGLEEVLKRAATDLDAVGAKWAIIGGLAVATRAAPVHAGRGLRGVGCR